MAAIIVKLECITNMHAGNGEVNYNIIDNEVERDPVTQYPAIYSSGVKGALREYFSQTENLKDKINNFFGSDKKGGNTAGRLKIMGADFLAMPVRATKGMEAYYLVTTQTALKRYEDVYRIFIGKDVTWENEQVVDCEADFIPLKEVVLFGDKKLHIVNEESYKEIDLPVMARNHLENGVSKNLWYEEIVPHDSIFTFAVIANQDDKALLDDFKKCIDGKVIQFGGNASIGYGLCKASILGE